MIDIRFEEREMLGLQYALETLHGCSPFGLEKIRRLRFYTPDERAELEEELGSENTPKIYDSKDLYDFLLLNFLYKLSSSLIFSSD